MIVMRMQSHLLLASSLIPASLLLGAASGASAQSLWSDASTWPSGEVPGEGDAVEITRDMDVVLDMDAPGLRSLTIQGKLAFSDERDISLESEWIYVPGGELQIGTEANPYQHVASITLTDNVEGEDINTMGDRGIMLMQGTLNLHGNRDNTWTKLSATAEKGATSITVLDASGWRVGDEIVLASTDFNPRQAERRHITAIDGNTISFAEPLEYMHFGEITFGVDERGEVGMLSRNIKIQASEDADESYFGGHIMAMSGSQMYIDSVELSRMGQHLTLARYPIHFHVLGEGQGMYVRNAAIHDTFNRCVTVHGTNNLAIERNVTFNTVGHCFFMEDGIENGNRFVENLGIQTKCHPTLDCMPTRLAAAGEDPTFEERYQMRRAGQESENVLLPSDNTVATFWITNPDNTYIGNVAAGSDSNGFWMSLPEHPNGQFEGTEIAAQTWPRRTPFREFRGNVAHSNYDGFMFDRNINQDNSFGVTGNAHMPKADVSDFNSATVENVFADLTAYKNRNGGIWGRGEMHIFSNARMADNAMGYTHASGNGGRDPYTSLMVDSLFVGETDNVGNPATPEELAYGRSLPKPLIPDFPIRGYEYYDYRHDVVNTTFVNYADNDLRDTGALSYLMYTSAGVSTENAIEGATFINAKPVHFPRDEFRWGNDHLGGVAWRTSAIHDKDGSVSGVPDSYILINDGVYDSVAADEENCEVRQDWNAAVCTGDYGRLIIGAPTRTAPPGDRPPAGSGPSLLGGGAGSDIPSRPAPPAHTLVRNGREFSLTSGQSTIRAGTEMELITDRQDASLTLREMDVGSWVIFSLPGFATAASGTQTGSLDALRAANDTAWFSDGEKLWVKMVAEETEAGPFGFRGGASIEVSREGLGG